MKSFLEHRADGLVGLMGQMNKGGKPKSKASELRRRIGAETGREHGVPLTYEDGLVRHPQHGMGSVPIPVQMMSTPVIDVLDDDAKAKAAEERIPLRRLLRQLLKKK